MFHYLFGALILVVMTISFTQQYELRGTLNAYYGLYKGVIETSVISYDDNGDKIYPYFDSSGLARNIVHYFDDNLKPYCRRYMVNFYFSDYKSANQPSKVKLMLVVTFSNASLFRKTAIFQVKDNTHE